MNSDLIGFISLVTGLVSFGASIAFFVVGRKTEEQNQHTLAKINEAIHTWQGKVMDSSINLLESRAEIVAARVAQEEARAKQAFLADISARVKFLVEELPPDKFTPAQSHQLDTLLKAFDAMTRGSLPPEALERIVSDRSKPL